MTDFSPDDYIRYRIKRARETMNEVQSHLDNGFGNTAINRMYYASFYAISALLTKHDIYVTSHNGLRQQFGQHFVKTGIISRELAKHFAELAEKRNRSDYNDFVDFDVTEARELYSQTQSLISAVITLVEKH